MTKFKCLSDCRIYNYFLQVSKEKSAHPCQATTKLRKPWIKGTGRELERYKSEVLKYMYKYMYIY